LAKIVYSLVEGHVSGDSSQDGQELLVLRAYVQLQTQGLDEPGSGRAVRIGSRFRLKWRGKVFFLLETRQPFHHFYNLNYKKFQSAGE
jgi:hypothetical protein